MYRIGRSGRFYSVLYISKIEPRNDKSYFSPETIIPYSLLTYDPFSVRHYDFTGYMNSVCKGWNRVRERTSE